jgi:hypothetical protein
MRSFTATLLTRMKCYNITFFLRLPLLRAKQQMPPKALAVLLHPGAPMKKPGFFSPCGGGRLLRRNQVIFKPWPVRPPVPVIWRNGFAD